MAEYQNGSDYDHMLVREILGHAISELSKTVERNNSELVSSINASNKDLVFALKDVSSELKGVAIEVKSHAKEVHSFMEFQKDVVKDVVKEGRKAIPLSFAFLTIAVLCGVFWGPDAMKWLIHKQVLFSF